LDSSWYVDSESMICFERSLLVDEKFEFKVWKFPYIFLSKNLFSRIYRWILLKKL
jgi:hypothetical protein